MHATITRAYTRMYTDTRQTVAIVEWSDDATTTGEASAPTLAVGSHMTALFDRAKHNGLTIHHEEV